MKKRFIFDENYIKKFRKKEQYKYLIIGAIVLLILIITIIIILVTKRNKKPVEIPKAIYEIKESMTLESGSLVPELSDYFTKLENVDKDGIEIFYPDDFVVSYDFSSCSAEELEVINNATEYNADNFKCAKMILKDPNTYGVTIKLLVKDTKAPIVTTKDIEIYKGESYKVEDFVQACDDYSDVCNLSYVEDIAPDGSIIKYDNYTEAGEYLIKFKATDKYDNVTEELNAKLTIIEPEKDVFRVTFDSKEGTKVTDMLVLDGETIKKPSDPVREGYIFKGWFLNNNEFDFNTPITGNTNLVAKWEKIPEEINPNPNTNPNPNPGIPSIVKVTSVSLNYKTIYLTIGESKTVKATVKPNNATYKTVSWNSQDNSIATVSEGVITGVKVGTTYITASADGKSAQVEVIVRDNSATTCRYGDANYNKDYILSVDFTKDGCAVDPNSSPNESVTTADFKKVSDELSMMGFKDLEVNFQHKVVGLARVKNTSGTGLVGYQITIQVSVIDTDNPYMVMSAQYIIKPDGTRLMLSNNITKNNVSFK